MRISDWSSDVCSSDLEARDPAIAEVLVIEGIEDARPAEARKAENSERADVKVTETRLQPPDQRCVGKDTVQIHWRLGSDHRMVAVGYGVMQKAQRRRSEEHTSELQSLMRTSYAIDSLQQKKHETTTHTH